MLKFISIIILFLLQKLAFANQYTTSAKEAILVFADTGQILYEKNASALMHPSSMTKIMTTYLVFDALDSGKLLLTDSFTTSEKAWKMEGSRMFLNYGDKPTVDELLKGIVVQSGNDACIVVAEGIAGDEAIFANKMNEMAVKLNMRQTNFTNSSGWPDPNNLSTAKDLSKLAISLINKFPHYYNYHQIKKFTYGNIAQNNRNILLGKMGVDGIKTGHTEAGGYGVVLSALQNDTRLVAVINGLASDKVRAQEGEKILNYGFSEFKKVNLIEKGDVVVNSQVLYGELPQVSLTVKDNLQILSKQSQGEIICSISYIDKVVAPISQGEKLGTIKCKIENIYDSHMTLDLVSSSSINEGGFFQRLFQNIESIL
jgi:D-alanyl-D-alanine carboxypeptidase (penicillin-binding protein 5/6)